MRALPALALVAALGFAGAAVADGGVTATPPPAPGAPPPPASGRPKIGVDRTTHDFGVVRQESEHVTTFTLRNDGTATLHLTGTAADCGCSVATLQAHEIAPGGTAPLEVRLRTFTMSGALSKRVRVLSDDPDAKELELHVKFDVAAGIVLEPARFYFGPVLVGTSPTTAMTMKWREGVGRPFHVLDVEAPGTDLVFETKPYEAPPWHGTTITARFPKPPTEVRTLSATARIRTDDPDVPNVTAAITAFVSGRIWLDRRAIALGFAQPGDARRTMVGCRGLTKDVDLGEVKVAAKGERVAARALVGATKGEWLVEVRIADHAKPGRIDETVEVSCSIPNEPAATIRVTGEVLAGAPR
jgi:hypothetical protein